MTATQQPTVFIVDDDVDVRDSIKELVESVGLRPELYASGQEFLETFQADRPGCLVLDVRMAGMSGLELQEKLAESGPTIPVIIITGHADVPLAVRALRGGAVDFIQKPYRDQLLLDSINNALAVDAAARHSESGSDDFDSRLSLLTKRERVVFDKVFEGGTSMQIASELGISPRTVEAHRRNLLRKLGVSSVKQLILRRVVRDPSD